MVVFWALFSYNFRFSGNFCGCGGVVSQFVHLNCHSCYSLVSGADRPLTLLKRAKELNMLALAITDTNGMYGAVEAQKRADQVGGVRHIFGVVVDQPEGGALALPKPSRYIVALARNQDGYAEICRLVTERSLNEAKFDIAMSAATLSDNVIAISSDPAVLEARRMAYGRQAGNIYVELVNHDDTASRRRAAFSLQLARRFDLPCVATNNVHFATPASYDTHRLLCAIRTRATISTLPDGAVASCEAWLKPPRMMERLFSFAPSAISNTLKIADECHVRLKLGELKFPKLHSANGEPPHVLLQRIVFTEVSNRYGSHSSAEVHARLLRELDVIEKLGFSGYFLIVHDIVREAKRRGIPTVGRGSAANSLVCFLLEITDICPIKYNLYFERFMNLQRKDCPDIDIDFPWNRRDEMLEYVYQTYGEQRVAMISTHNTFRGRSIVREVGKALGIPVCEIEKFTRKMPGFIKLSELDEARRAVPECKNLPIEDEPYRSILEIGLKIEGFPRHLSIHCGGIVISPCPITDLVPLQRSANGFVITQFDMYPIEDMGLVKIDLLSQRALAVVMDVIDAVKRNYGIKIDWSKINPAEDEGAKNIMRNGETVGCFYVESPGMRSLLRKLKVDDFETLTAASSIIRPGVSGSGMMKAYIDRSLGREEPSYLCPEMESVLGETFGVMIYQEDVIKVANVVAGMGLGEADALRRCMSKKRNWEDIGKYKKRFIGGAMERGVDKEVAEEIWRQIESFGGYAFCKAHSASFAVVSYQTAYLKAHYPAEFMAAVISNRGGFYSASAYVEEARRMGLSILGPDVNKSGEECTSSVTP